MAVIALLAPVLLLVQDHAPASVTGRNPRTQPLTAEDALWTLVDVSGRIVPTSDLDGDGLADLAIARGGTRSIRESVARIDAVSARTGIAIRTLWSADSSPSGEVSWDAGGDLDGDGAGDVLIGLPAAANGDGAVQAVCGRTSELLYVIRRPWNSVGRFGWSVAILGDVNADGQADYAVGTPEVDPTRMPPESRRIVSYRSSGSSNGDQKHSLVFEGGKAQDQREYWRERLPLRSDRRGLMSVRSGCDGSELYALHGDIGGHAFGYSVRRIGDIDGDGKPDGLVQCDLRSDQPTRVFSGATGATVRDLKPRFLGLVGPAGDLDGDHIEDLFLDRMDDSLHGRIGEVEFVSAKTDRELFTLPNPDFWSEYGVTVALGDLDGDGFGDVALGDANYHIGGHPGDADAPDLRAMNLTEALALESRPWCAFSWESGCALVYSGRTRRVIFGAWGEPASGQGMGLAVAPLGDVNGDGYRDIVVTDGERAYAFAGPGPE